MRMGSLIGDEPSSSAEGFWQMVRYVPPVVRWFFMADVLVMAAAMVNFGVASYWGMDHPSFLRLNAESNLPTWFSAFQHGVVGLLFGCLAIREIRVNRRRLCIALPAVLFLFFSLDETAMVHERLSAWLRAGWGLNIGDDITNNAPVMVIAAPLVMAVVALAVGLTRRYWLGRPGVAIKFVAGIAIFLFCAAGLEILVNYVHWRLLTRCENLLEEGGEMVGATTVLWSAVELLAAEKLAIVFDRGGIYFE